MSRIIRKKELKQYVLVYLLVTVVSVGFQVQITTLASLFEMIAIDIFAGVICVLVFCIK